MATDIDAIPGLLRARGITLGTPLTVLAETTSTNDDAKRAAKNGAPHGATWIAESQNAGRGRQGRAWVSPPGENILLSVLTRFPCPPLRLPLMSLVAGLSARDAIARAAPHADVRVKWPNDVLAFGRKIAGILVEGQFASNQVESLVIGVGINVHTRVFPEEIRELATSVALHSDPSSSIRPGETAGIGEPPNRATLVVDLLEALERDLPLVAARGLGPLHARLTAVDALRGQRVHHDQGGSGIAEGIDMEGRLLLRRDDGSLERLGAGEVHLGRASGST